jgi:peptidoglycan/LPS O-acetylase OafA/YrhL
MHPLHPLFAIAIFSIALLTGYLLKKKSSIHPGSGRYASIDGMRGFLAIGVFIHHSAVWHQYLQTGIWDAPKSNLYCQLGQTSVALFFMITSFLFVSKLLNAEKNKFSWKNFFISRIFRLSPMYYFSLMVIIIIVMFSSGWQMNSSPRDLLSSIMNWGFFTLLAAPAINGSDLTSLINARVVWSLPYEWLFYFCLPLISVLLFRKEKLPYGFIVLGLIFTYIFYEFHGVIISCIYPFIGGIIAAMFVKLIPFKKKSNPFVQAMCSVIILSCLILLKQESPVQNTALLTIAFTLVAYGNSLSGILKNSTLRLLGEISYSTYLLHGIVLFTVFYFGFGFERSRNLDPFEYCLLVAGCTPFIILLSFLGYKYIEKPFIMKGRALSREEEKIVNELTVKEHAI